MGAAGPSLAKDQAAPDAKKMILTSFPILQDVTSDLVPIDLAVQTLTPRGQDPHSYTPSARDTLRLQQATLILTWGLGLDRSIEDFIKKSQPKASHFIVTDNVPTLTGISKGHHHGRQDPHLWQSPMRMILIVQRLSHQLQKTFPEHREQIDKKTKSYVTELKKLNDHYKREFSKIPSARKKFITPHQAFQYLADDMGLSAESLRGLDSQADPSAKSIQKLIEAAKSDKFAALFDEAGEESRLLKRLSQESHIPVLGVLYTDTLFVDDGPQTYLQLIAHNLKTVLASLKEK